ncbi:MOSC domain-containing protein [Hoyosella sp. YIM 151337]|uniref:MOSC domain-containing protein n=1 Tax=Hoyosella sp. YIM 151337 TaxID=2992742 RepID=UPI0022356736|nr:MOSC domain-containing protein [Hoyosella sp. YIM 151337]MCW4354402.1 MOSC domain-containing protein [Hoyosella sp. YIM 151337]
MASTLSDHPKKLIVDGVFVGQPADLGMFGRERVQSAIVKHPVTSERVALRATNLDGDGQADLINHGGADKAVYLYPAEHYSDWAAEGYSLEPGQVGENVSLRGALESTVRIGDVWQWGEALVQVSQPRQPCFKLGMRTGTKAIIADMVDSGRCGWYARVLQPGEVPVRGGMLLVERSSAPTVATMFAMLCQPGPVAAGEIHEALGVAALAASWKDGLRKSLARRA